MLGLLDGHPFAVRHDLPELGRFMLATGLRLGEALGRLILTGERLGFSEPSFASRDRDYVHRSPGMSPVGALPR
jgi:hypothetical protein